MLNKYEKYHQLQHDNDELSFIGYLTYTYHFIYMVGSKNVLYMQNQTKYTFYDKYEEESSCSLFVNCIE